MGKGIALVKYWAGLALCVALLLVQGAKAGEPKPLYFTCVIDSEAPYFDYIEYTYAKILEPLGYRFSLISGRPEEVRGWLSEGAGRWRLRTYSGLYRAPWNRRLS